MNGDTHTGSCWILQGKQRRSTHCMRPTVSHMCALRVCAPTHSHTRTHTYLFQQVHNDHTLSDHSPV